MMLLVCIVIDMSCFEVQRRSGTILLIVIDCISVGDVDGDDDDGDGTFPI